MSERNVATREERAERNLRVIQAKKDGRVADEAAVDQMIRDNIAQYGA